MHDWTRDAAAARVALKQHEEREHGRALAKRGRVRTGRMGGRHLLYAPARSSWGLIFSPGWVEWEEAGIAWRVEVDLEASGPVVRRWRAEGSAMGVVPAELLERALLRAVGELTSYVANRGAAAPTPLPRGSVVIAKPRDWRRLVKHLLEAKEAELHLAGGRPAEVDYGAVAEAVLEAQRSGADRNETVRGRLRREGWSGGAVTDSTVTTWIKRATEHGYLAPGRGRADRQPGPMLGTHSGTHQARKAVDGGG